MSPKQKPEENPVWFNFTISPSEKARWKAYAKKQSVPLATIIKMEMNKIIDAEFEIPLKNLLNINKDILGVIIFQNVDQILYRYGEIEAEDDFRSISQRWKSYKVEPPKNGYQYLQEEMQTIQSNMERLMIISNPKKLNGAKASNGANNPKGTNNPNGTNSPIRSIIIIGYRLENHVKFLARIKPNGNAMLALADLQRLAVKMFPPQTRPNEKGILENSLPEMYQEKSHLQTVEILRRIPLVPQEQSVIEKLEELVGKPIPVFTPFQNGEITQTNPKFELSPLMYFAIDGHIIILRLEKSNLKEIPKFVAQLSELQYLSLNNNCIAEIPDILADLPNLQVLSLINNQITELPESIYNLQNLRELQIAGNPITELQRKNPSIDIPAARLIYLKNTFEENLFGFLKQLNQLLNGPFNISNNEINLELVAIIEQFLQRIKQNFDKNVLSSYVFLHLSGL